MKKNYVIWIFPFIIVGIILMITDSCKKDSNNIDLKTVSTVTDIDGNVYHTVAIGTQVWMVENLKTTKYNDGTAIPLIKDSATWANLTTPGYCWYQNDPTYIMTTGALYNWYAVNTGILCPTGWHVPSDSDFIALSNNLGGGSIAGGKLKEIGTTHWRSPNMGADNFSGFTALPGGYRNNHGFYGLEVNGSWWATTPVGASNAMYLYLDNESAVAQRINYMKMHGFSVRCIKN
jgi:uncharacterized protein (TIGR02145 family)